MFSISFFFANKKLKNAPSKVAHKWPKPFIPQSSPAHSPQLSIDFSYHKMSGTSICSLICAMLLNWFKLFFWSFGQRNICRTLIVCLEKPGRIQNYQKCLLYKY